ncbi:MAG: copper resistance protein CopC [Sandarakinorhabdus sp.]|nr:copper resistance protein CopC [Sandarakinorhabdus sp.]
MRRPSRGSNLTRRRRGDAPVRGTRLPPIRSTYLVGWHVVSADTHRVAGSLRFTAK